MGDFSASTCSETPVSPSKKPTKEQSENDFCQWATSNHKHFFPVGKTVDRITPGFYQLTVKSDKLCFELKSLKLEELIQFNNSVFDSVIKEIETFWNSKEKYLKYQLPYKRGFLLYGPPGCGKTSLIYLIAENIIRRGGLCIDIKNPEMFVDCFNVLRQIHPDIPVVALLEDLDALFERTSDSFILNMLDGVIRLDNIIFLATTNYPERLGPRIINRPSRFDKRIKIPLPDVHIRKHYISDLISRTDKNIEKADLSKMTKDTEGFSLAHIKEMFVSVYILENDYDEVLNILKDMKKLPTSDDDEVEVFPKRLIGFAQK